MTVSLHWLHGPLIERDNGSWNHAETPETAPPYRNSTKKAIVHARELQRLVPQSKELKNGEVIICVTNLKMTKILT